MAGVSGLSGWAGACFCPVLGVLAAVLVASAFGGAGGCFGPPGRGACSSGGFCCGALMSTFSLALASILGDSAASGRLRAGFGGSGLSGFGAAAALAWGEPGRGAAGLLASPESSLPCMLARSIGSAGLGVDNFGAAGGLGMLGAFGIAVAAALAIPVAAFPICGASSMMGMACLLVSDYPDSTSGSNRMRDAPSTGVPAGMAIPAGSRGPSSPRTVPPGPRSGPRCGRWHGPRPAPGPRGGGGR